MPAKPISKKAKELAYAKHGKPPWDCWYCELIIDQGRYNVHHLDGDHDNDVAENLVVVHHGCHTKIHKPWLILTDDGRRRLSEAAKRNKPWLHPNNPGHTGHKHSVESRAKVSASKQGQKKGWSWKIDPATGKRVWYEK